MQETSITGNEVITTPVDELTGYKQVAEIQINTDEWCHITIVNKDGKGHTDLMISRGVVYDITEYGGNIEQFITFVDKDKKVAKKTCAKNLGTSKMVKLTVE